MSAHAPLPGPAAEPFDPAHATQAELAAVHTVLRACHDEAGQPVPYRPLAGTLAFLRFPPADEDRPAWVVRAGGEPVGLALIRRQHSADTAHVEVQVRPDVRRRGAGTLLLDAARGHARDSGLRTLLGLHSTPAGAAFAHRAGAVDGTRHVRSVLRLDGPAPAVPAGAPAPGYRLLSWSDGCPEQLLASYALAREAINDAPDDAGPEVWSPQRVRDLEETVARRGGRTLVTVALHGDDTVAAFTEMRLPAPQSATASIEDTAVVPAHRRRGLALSVKSAALAALRAAHPGVTLVTTTNAEANHPIRAVNHRLGFTAALVRTTAVLAV